LLALSIGARLGRVTVASHASAKKRIRQTAKRTARNRHVRSTVRTFIKRARQAIEAGNQGAAQEALREAESSIRKAVSKGVVHHKTGSRYVSRLTLAANAKTAA
jgi:small subunit ribosomal protein S20